MDLQFTNKLALASGSTKGIGLAIAMGLAREGAKVILHGRPEKFVSLAKILQKLPQALAMQSKKAGTFPDPALNLVVYQNHGDSLTR